jgi:DNA-binding NtrC family response regulator
MQDFPGNVRELRNLLERTALLCDGDVIEPDHVHQAIATGRRTAPRPGAVAQSAPSGQTGGGRSRPVLKSLERAALRETVAAHTGSRSELAQRLGISERSLYRKIKALGLDGGAGTD